MWQCIDMLLGASSWERRSNVGENDSAGCDRPVTGRSVRRGAQHLSGCKRSLNYMLHNQRLSFPRAGGDVDPNDMLFPNLVID